ncbi:DUF1133 family protein [Winslowiella toletana]|nr:DUF1133 family protein [Winslowiella toletana]
MIYPSTVGKADASDIRLCTLETVWIQGKLRMWGRWSYIGGGSVSNMFNQLLASGKITQKAISEILHNLKKSGLSKDELAAYFRELLASKHKSSLVFCTDHEAMIIDRVVSEVLFHYPQLIRLLHDRFDGRGKSKKQLAREFNNSHPERSLRTCETRIDIWLNIAESMLYRPMCDAFEINSERFRLHGCANSD